MGFDNRIWYERDYPNLVSTNYHITSADTIDYNCVAWAAEDTQRWWWPDPMKESYWPVNVPRVECDRISAEAEAKGHASRSRRVGLWPNASGA
ncbi:MAG: hypothetical protein F6K55_18900 [Moorea sp. SIO4A3]|nr:hypothetical protein [Moorena sp. SIO4A3]